MKKFWLWVSIVLCMALYLASVAIFAANGDIQITVKIMNGNRIDLTVQPDDTISKVKTLIQEKEGILPDQQRLTFNNQELDENKTLAEYNIKNKSMLELTAPVKSVSTEEELKAALAGSTMCYVKLAADITVTNTMNIRKGSSVILDLNGCVFDLGGNKIYVNDRNLPTRLTIIDSRPDAEHKFTPEDGLWVLDETDGTKTVNGGVITGGHSDSSDNAGCIDVGLNGTVIMEAGNIVGCYADGHGGALHVGGTDGTFIMNGGSIAGCNAGSMGGGVSVDSRSGSFTMNGGSITDCVTGTNSSDSGGGVSVERGTFTLAGGTIQNCTAGDGAGVYVSADTTFTMTGGIIQHCVADNNGGALYINGGTMNAGSGTVDGTVMVNTYYDYNSNSDIPGVIQGIAGRIEDTLFKQDVFNAGEIRYGTFLGKVTVGDNTSKGVIRDGVFNNVVIVNCGSVFKGTFNGDVVINDVPSVEPPLLSGGNYNRLIKNNSANALFEGAHIPNGIVGTKPSTTSRPYYKVTFVLNGGDMEYPERYFCNKGIISDYIEPTKEGCIFDGWYKADGKKWNCVSDVVTEDVTLTAMWKHIHCICGGAAYDGHTKHTDATWMPWTSTGSLPTAAGNYYLVGNVTLPEGRISLPDGVNLCLNGNKINYGKKYAVYTEISVADNGTFSVTDCGTTGGFGNFDIFDSKLVMYGGKIIKDSALRINGGASFLMTGNAQNDGVIVIKGYSGFIMSGNAKNDGFISLLETDDKGTVEFCGRADGGSVVIYQPQENAKIHMYNNAKITGLYATTSCIIRLIMQDSAEIGEVKNIDFRSVQLSGNAKLGTADSSFSIKAYEKAAGITIKDNVKLFGTVTVQLDDDATFTLEGKASITGELIVKKSGTTGNRATVVMAGESAVHGKLTCRDDAITFEMQDSATIDGDIDLGGAQVNGKVICTGDIIDGIFNGDVENNGRIIDGIFNGKVTGNGTIEDSAKVDFIFNTNGGDAVVKQRILRGQKAQKPTAISKAGYIFDSWQLGGAIFDFATTPITEDTTITAVWTQCDHSGSTAHPTCTASATCTVCAGTIAAIGHSPETGYKHDETSHWIACRNCNEELNKASHAGTDDGDCTTAVLCEECKYIITAARSSHTWDAWTSNGNNTHTHRCTVKGCMAGTETENCSGGTATCLKLAECDYCKQKYGNINSGNHVNLRKIPAVASTAISKGNIEYFVCDGCKKFFADEKGTKEITLADTITEKAAPTIIFGADSKWYRYGANEYLEFRSEALYADFISVSIDGKLLDESQYEKSEGSIIIRIKADYLNSILTGKHTVTITSVSGDANANFVVTFPDADVPTGDSFIIWLASFAAGLSGLISSAVVFVKKRSKHKEN